MREVCDEDRFVVWRQLCTLASSATDVRSLMALWIRGGCDMASTLDARPTLARGAATSGARPAVALTRRFAWGVAIVGLGLAIALGGCGAQTARNGNNNGASVSGQQTQTTGANTSANTPTTAAASSSAAQQVLNLDQQTQNDTNSLDNSQNDANTDYSSQDTPTQP